MENSLYCQYSQAINEQWNPDELTNRMVRQNNGLTSEFTNPMIRQNNDLTQNNFAAYLKESNLMNLVGYVTQVFQPPATAVIQKSPGSDRVKLGTVIWLRKHGGNINDIDGYRALGVINAIFENSNQVIYNVLLYNAVDLCLRIDSPVFCMPGNH